jgi:DNA segregation ATPase FtsK/SpoIIIE, S-DNA-T family
MAKKITKPSKIKGIINFLKSNQFRYTLGVFLTVFSGYLVVAFASYTFSGKVDQSKLDLPWQEFLFDPSVQVQNIAGKGGAYLSEQFVNLGFGFPSLFFILIFMVGALNLFGFKGIRFFKTLLFSLLWMLWSSIAIALALSVSSGDQFLYVGGMYGFIVVVTWRSGSRINFALPAFCINPDYI